MSDSSVSKSNPAGGPGGGPRTTPAPTTPSTPRAASHADPLTAGLATREC
jgi:hypothetical protein